MATENKIKAFLCATAAVAMVLSVGAFAGAMPKTRRSFLRRARFARRAVNIWRRNRRSWRRWRGFRQRGTSCRSRRTASRSAIQTTRARSTRRSRSSIRGVGTRRRSARSIRALKSGTVPSSGGADNRLGRDIHVVGLDKMEYLPEGRRRFLLVASAQDHDGHVLAFVGRGWTRREQGVRDRALSRFALLL